MVNCSFNSRVKRSLPPTLFKSLEGGQWIPPQREIPPDPTIKNSEWEERKDDRLVVTWDETSLSYNNNSRRSRTPDGLAAGKKGKWWRGENTEQEDSTAEKNENRRSPSSVGPSFDIGRRLIDSFLLFRGGILPAVPKGKKDLPRRIRTGLEQAKNNSSWQIAKLVFADIQKDNPCLKFLD